MIQKAIEWRHNSQSDAMTGTPKPTGPRSKKVKSNIDTSGSEVEEESEEEGSNDDNDINHEEEWSPNTKASKKATPNSSTRKSPRKSRRSVIEPNTVPSKKSTPFSRNVSQAGYESYVHSGHHHAHAHCIIIHLDDKTSKSIDPT